MTPPDTVARFAIDVHAHLFPQSAVHAERSGAEWFGSRFEAVDERDPPVVVTGNRRIALGNAAHRDPPEDRLRAMRARGVSMQVVSLLPPLFRYELPAQLGIAAARRVNDEIVEMTRSYPESFLGLATLPLQDVKAALGELERAMSLGMAGISIGTHVAGVDLDDHQFRPLFQMASEHRAFVLCHPADPRHPGSLGEYYLSNVVGNPLETTLAFSRLVLGGVLDEAPDMRICFSHGGGYIPAASGRLDHAFKVRPETSGSRRPPSEYLRSVYFDCLTHDPVSLQELVRRVGADRVLLGSDYPADMGYDDPTASIRGAGLPAEDQEAILWGNAARLFDLSPPTIFASESATDGLSETPAPLR